MTFQVYFNQNFVKSNSANSFHRNIYRAPGNGITLRMYTVDEIIKYLDDNFNIADDGFNSDVEGFEYNEFDDNYGNLLLNSDIGTDDNEEVT